jgi:hypothetical protein
MAYASSKINKYTARNRAEEYGIDFDKSVFKLSNDDKSYLLELAKKVGYKKSSGSSLSRAGAFFEYLRKI